MIRLISLLLALALAGCTSIPAARHQNPHVTAPSLRAAAAVCAERGYIWIAQTGARAFYCLATNIDDEPAGYDVRLEERGALVVISECKGSHLTRKWSNGQSGRVQ